jgi:uncharacterized protein (DUF1015 family)
MRGVVALIRIDPEYRQIVPHERTFEKPVEDRLKLLAATAWDLEPIEMLYPGKSGEAAMWAYIDGSGRNPDLVATGADGAQHEYWRITDPAVIGTVVEAFKGRKAYIADGHHRYATSVRYSQLRRQGEYRPPKNAPYDYKMCVLVNMDDPGLAILPTHRIVVKPKVKARPKVLASLDPRFEREEVEPAKDVAAQIQAMLAEPSERPVLALWFGKKGGLHKLTARTGVVPENLAEGKSFGWRTLDVGFLQLLVVRDAFGIPEERWGDDVRYTQDWPDAIASAGGAKAVASVFHRPVRTRQLRAVVDAGEVMPQKSTYFVPKMLSGACFYRIGKEPAGREFRRPTS